MDIALYKLSENLIALDNRIQEILLDETLSPEDQEMISEEIFQVYLENEGDFREKLSDCVGYIQELEAITKARKDEAKRLNELAKSSEQRASKFREYVGGHLRRIGMTNLELTNSKLSLRKRQPELVLDCEVELLPEQFKRVKVEADKVALRQSLKTKPEAVKGLAHLQDNEEFSLVIK